MNFAARSLPEVHVTVALGRVAARSAIFLCQQLSMDGLGDTMCNGHGELQMVGTHTHAVVFIHSSFPAI